MGAVGGVIGEPPPMDRAHPLSVSPALQPCAGPAVNEAPRAKHPPGGAVGLAEAALNAAVDQRVGRGGGLQVLHVDQRVLVQDDACVRGGWSGVSGVKALLGGGSGGPGKPGGVRRRGQEQYPVQSSSQRPGCQRGLTRVEDILGVEQLLELPHELGGLGACKREAGWHTEVAAGGLAARCTHGLEPKPGT